MVFSQNNGNNGNNGQGVTQWKTNGNITDTTNFIGTTNNRDVKFKTNNIEYLRITKEGNVGIGTSQPESKLDVNGNVIFRNGFKLPGLLDAPTDVQGILLIKNDGTVSKGGLDHLRSLMYLDVNASDGSCGDGNDLNPTWANGLNKIYYNCPQIKVGIITDSPQYTLDVRGRGFFSQGIKLGSIVENSFSNFALIEAQRPTGGSVNSTPFIRFSVKETNGTQNVRFKVENSGGVFCTSLRVRLAADIPVPDFVFTPTYILMPLTELKAYVTTHNHLPSIPSEKEIREQGLSIEEMQMKLLQKIEELTLYLIELSEKNQELTVEIQRQKVQFEKEFEKLKIELKN